MSWLYQPLLPATAEIQSIPPAPISVAYWVGGPGTWDATDPTHWSATSGGPGGAGYPDASSTVYFDTNSGLGDGQIVTVNGGVCNDINLLFGFAVVPVLDLAGSLTVYGNWTKTGLLNTSSTTGLGVLTFASTGPVVIDTNGGVWYFNVIFDGAGGTWTIQGSDITVGPTNTLTLTRGSIDLNGKILSTGTFSSNNTNARSITSATPATIALTFATAATVWNTNTITNLTGSNNVTVSITGNNAVTKTISVGALSETNAFNFTVGGNGTTIAFSDSAAINNLTITNTTCTIPNRILTIYGNLSVQGISPTLSAGASAWTFAATSGTKTITTNAKTLDFPITFAGAGGTWQLVDNLTVGSSLTTTLTRGTLDLNGKTLSTGIFNSSNTNTRSLTSATAAQIVLTYSSASAIVWDTVQNLRMTGSANVTVVITGNDAITKTIRTGSGSETSVFNFTVGGNGTTISFTSVNAVHDLTITDSSCTITNVSLYIYGSLTINGTNPVLQPSDTWAFAATSGTKSISTGGMLLDFHIAFIDGSGTTWKLVDDLTVGATKSIYFNAGTLDLNGKTFSAGASFSIDGIVTKNLTFNGGTLLCPGTSATAFNNASPATFTTTSGTSVGKISMSGATAKTFAGGGATYDCILENSGAGALTISGSNAFYDITNSVSPATFTFTAGTTTTVNNFTASGTAGNVVTINSTGAAFTLSKAGGTVNVSYCTISNSTATGGAIWQAYTTNGNTDGGGNTGWLFAAPIVYVTIDNNVVLGAGILISF